MNIWLIAAIGFALVTFPCGIVLARAPLMTALAAVQLGTGASVLALTVIAMGLGRPSFLDIGLTLALLAYPASLLFAHFFERWL